MLSKPQIRIPLIEFADGTAEMRVKGSYIEIFGIPAFPKILSWTRTLDTEMETYDVNYILEKRWPEVCLVELFPNHTHWNGTLINIKFVLLLLFTIIPSLAMLIR